MMADDKPTKKKTRENLDLPNVDAHRHTNLKFIIWSYKPNHIN
jgi:hypothetical protein